MCIQVLLYFEAQIFGNIMCKYFFLADAAFQHYYCLTMTIILQGSSASLFDTELVSMNLPILAQTGCYERRVFEY
jgi:hypothetical protein